MIEQTDLAGSFTRLRENLQAAMHEIPAEVLANLNSIREREKES